MKRRAVPEAVLEHLREIGDPKLEPAPQKRGAARHRRPNHATAQRYFEVVAEKGLDAALDSWADREVVRDAVRDDTAEAVKALEDYGVKPAVVIPRARALFTKYGDEICASLLLAGLPDAYACEWGARVLIAHGDLVWALPRRVRQTAMFLMTVFAENDLVGGKSDPGSTARIEKTCAGLRLFHHMVRTQLKSKGDPRDLLGDENTTPINQEDLLGTLLTFTVTTFGVLDQLGVQWSDDDLEAYLLFWDLAGAALGVGTKTVFDKLRRSPAIRASVPDPLRPRRVDHATQLLDQLHDRQWLPVQDTIKSGRPFPWSGLAPGRMLGDALLDALTDAMPAARRTWPGVVMRELAPTIVQSRLGLEGAGLSSYATRWVAERSRYAQTARAATLRMMANDITRHAMESFLRADGPPFKIPGLDLREITASATTPPILELK